MDPLNAQRHAKTETCFRVSLLFAACCLSILVAAQGLKLSGTVRDDASAPIFGANVRLLGLEQTTSTDEFGHFSFEPLPMGTYTVKVNAIAFASASQEVRLNKDMDLRFVLAIAAIDLKEVSIAPRSGITMSQTIGALDRDLRPVQNAQDLLKMVPGLFIAQHAGGGKAEQIFLRGFDNDHGTDVFLAVDGMPVNMVSHAHGQGYADLHFVIPETVDRINVHKGPYTTRFGDFSNSGTVEFTTRDHIEQNLVKAEGGMFNTFRGVAMVDLLGTKHLFSKKKENLYVAGEYAFTDAYFIKRQDFHRANGLLKYSGQLGEASHLSFSASSFGARWSASGQVPQRAIDNGTITRFGAIDDQEGGSTSRTNVNAVITTRMDNDAVLKNQVYYVKYAFSLFSNFTFFRDDSIQGDMINQRDDRNILGYAGTYTRNALIGDRPLKWTAGSGARYDQGIVQLLRARARSVNDTVRSGALDQLSYNAFLDGKLEVDAKWSMNLGARFDVYDYQYTEHLNDSLSGHRILSRVSPKFNIYHQTAENVQFYMLSGIGFHSNDARSVVLRQAGNSLPSAFGMDLGSTFKPAPRVLMNVAVWGLWMESELVYVGDGGTTEIGTPTERIGVDLGIRYQLSDRVHADADVNYAHGRVLDVPSDENSIPLAPQFTARGGVAFKQDKGINATVRFSCMADRPADPSRSVVAKGYFLVDAGASYRYEKVEVGFSVENLLNAEWNQAQFDTESRLRGESTSVSELHFTPGTPFFIKGTVNYRF